MASIISAYGGQGSIGRSLADACAQQAEALSSPHASGIESISLTMGRSLDLGLSWRPGQPLTGNVTLVVQRDTELDRLRVDVVGEGQVDWKDEGVRGRRYHAHEKYVDESITLAEGEGMGRGVLLERGTHRFGFEIQLPRNLPSSFMCAHGSVTYVVRALVHESRRLEPVVVSEPVIVSRPLLVPDEQQYTTTVRASDRRAVTSSATCWMPSRVRLDVVLNRRGHVVNGDLIVGAQVRNSTHKSVTCLAASVDMMTTLYAEGRELTDIQSIANKQDVWEVGKGQGRQWSDVRLPIPGHVPGSRLLGCQLIDVQYQLRFTASISGDRKPLEVVVPLLIGTGAVFTAEQRSSALSRYSELSTGDDVFSSGSPSPSVQSPITLQPPPAPRLPSNHTDPPVANGHTDGHTDTAENGHTDTVDYQRLDLHRRMIQEISAARDLQTVKVDEGATAF